MSSKINSDSPLANVVSEIEERRCDLIDRHRHLRDKVATMGHSIPALLTCNIWRMTSDDRDRHDAPYRIVRQIVDKFSPDPVDRFLAELKDAIDDLRLETSQLHDKIIDADVKLEETAMELESLELANKEMEEKVTGLRNRARKHSAPSLHSIHSEDLICLRKIRQLAEEELNLKSCIKELEDKEDTYRRQMRQFLPCEKFQRDGEKLMGCVQNSTGNGREVCRLPQVPKRNANATKERYTSRNNGQACHLLNLCENLCPSLSHYVPLDSCAPCSITKHKAHDKRATCESSQPICPAAFKSGPSCPMMDAYREPALGAISKADVPHSLKHLTHSSVIPCNPGTTCNACVHRQKNDSCNRCGCEKKCTYELSTAPCNCGIPPSSPTARASMTSEVLRSKSEVDDDISDEEFCECCTCDEGNEESTQQYNTSTLSWQNV